MKKIIFLGGSTQQIPAIQYAKMQGYYTILCDYLPDNPGQTFSDEFYCVSTTDKKAILEVAKAANIDGIVAYASDPAAPTAAYIGNELNLPSNPYESVLILCRKDLFRKFLRKNGFNCPKSKSFKIIDEARESLINFCFPIMLKPTDSSGTKGVTRIDSKEQFEDAFEKAMNNSKEKKIIIEEFIEMAHEYMIGGDVFVLDGKLEFCGFLNSHRDANINPFVPMGTSYPLFVDDNKKVLILKEVQRVLDLLKIKMGAFNIEIMFDKSGKLYIIEIGPRNGGNMIPDLLDIITGVDLIGATVEVALGNNAIEVKYDSKDVFYSTYVIHSSKKGKLKDIIFRDDIRKNIFKKVMYKENESQIDVFDSADKALGIIFLKYNSLEELKYKMDNMNEFIDIQII